MRVTTVERVSRSPSYKKNVAQKIEQDTTSIIVNISQRDFTSTTGREVARIYSMHAGVFNKVTVCPSSRLCDVQRRSMVAAGCAARAAKHWNTSRYYVVPKKVSAADGKRGKGRHKTKQLPPVHQLRKSLCSTRSQSSFQTNSTLRRLEQWKCWYTRWELCHVIPALSKQDQETQINMLMYAMGKKAEYV